MDERWYWHWFCSLETLNPVKKLRLFRQTNSVETLFHMDQKKVAAFSFLTPREQKRFLESRNETDHFRRSYERMKTQGIRLITLEDEEYPSRLLHIYGPPCGLYIRGRLPVRQERSAAVIGARICSSYGKEMAWRTGRTLAQAGIQVIGGMAAGIDGAGHRGALETGRTYAVLGCGVDQCYPLENRDLFERIPVTGGLISEFPPGSRPLSWHFPQRNRLISGLSDLVAVIEAKKKSGSLITVEYALDQGKDVFALPGMVTDALSEGCHQLIKNGAGLFSSPADLLEILAPNRKNQLKSSKEIEMGLVFIEKKVYSCLDFRARSMEKIAINAGLSVSETAQALIQLEIKGLARRTGLSAYEKISPEMI